MRLLPRRRDESGATAIIVTLMATFLVGMLAFTADMGIGYANQRQLQTAADAAALGAASVFAQSQETSCSDVLTTEWTAAQGEASDQVDNNEPATAPGALTYNATCSTTDGLVVTATVTGNSPNIFGKIVGQSSDYPVTRNAAAVVEPATGVGSRLRPLAVCSGELPSTISPGDGFKVFAPGNGHTPPASCPVPPNPGNWWTLDCPEDVADDADEHSARGTAALENQIRNGCSKPVSIVPGQDAATSPSSLNSILAAACPSVSTTAPFACLSGDPGQPDAGHIEDAWKDLIDSGTSSLIPVFCAETTCATTSITGTGTSALFPVHKFIAVTVCGYHFGKQPSRIYRPTSPNVNCAPHSGDLAAMAADNSDLVYLYMVFHNAQVSGSTSPSGCVLGDTTCDTGVRQVRMVAGPFTD